MKYLLNILAVCVSSMLPFIALAQTQQQPNGSGLVPCGAVPFMNYLAATSCNFCYLAQLAQNVVNFLVMITIPLSIMMFAWAGIAFFTSAGNPKKISHAKKIFSSVFIGFVIAITGWLVVQVVLQTIVNPDFYTASNWVNLRCEDFNGQSSRPRDNKTADFLQGRTSIPVTSLPDTTNPADNGGGTNTGGNIGAAKSVGPDGTNLDLPFSTSRSDPDLSSTYDKVMRDYGSQIQQACANSSLQNCTAVVAAEIVAESSGNPNARNPVSGAQGLMQVLPSTGGAGCGTNTQCQINAGVQYLQAQYEAFKFNIPNALAAYNSGPSTVPGGAGNGLNSAMVTSVNCGSSYYAWQCATNPGGLAETQKYVANVCRTLALKNQSGCGF